METEQATTVQPATENAMIETNCKLVAYYLKTGEYDRADEARERVEFWVLRKHGKRLER